MGYAFNVDVKEIRDKAILDVAAPLVKADERQGQDHRHGHRRARGRALRLEQHDRVPLQAAERADEGRREELHGRRTSTSPPARSSSRAPADLAAVRAAVEQLGLTAAALGAAPTVATHDADVPRVAIYSQWSGTQELGWYRHAFDQFGIPVRPDLQGAGQEGQPEGRLRRDPHGGAEHQPRAGAGAAGRAPAAVHEERQVQVPRDVRRDAGHDAAASARRASTRSRSSSRPAARSSRPHSAVRFPIEFGFARIDRHRSACTGVNAQKPLVQAEIVKTDHPVVLRLRRQDLPDQVRRRQQTFFRVGVADQGNVLARFVGGDAAVLSGLMVGGDAIRGRAFAVDVPEAHNGKGRVIMFANNPIYRWQNHGEFNMVFNSIMNWNDSAK